MFDTTEGTLDHQLNAQSEACWHRLSELSAVVARAFQEVTELVREAEDRADWKRAGFSSNAQWLEQAFPCEYRTALRVTRTSEALRELPALDDAMSKGDLTLDQVVATLEVATPETDAELARIAVGKTPSEIARAARAIVPPVVADDQVLYKRRALRMTWTVTGASSSSAARCHSNKASRSSRRSGTSPNLSAPPTRRPAPRCWSGGSTPLMRSSRSPTSRARPPTGRGAVRRR